MDCKEIRNQLSDYIDGGLSEEATERVARHLDSCPRCSEAYEDMARLVGLMQDMDAIDEPADLLANVKARLEKAPSLWERMRELFAAPAFRVPAAAAVLAAVLLIALYVPSGHDTKMIFEPLTTSKDAVRREPAAKAPEIAAEEPARELGDELADELAATVEKPAPEPTESDADVLKRQLRERMETELAKKGTATTAGQASESQPALGALEDSPRPIPAEQKRSALAATSKEEPPRVEGTLKEETESPEFAASADEGVAANKAAPSTAPAIVADDTLSIAATENERVFAAIDSADGEILRSYYDDQKHLTALDVEFSRDRYWTFLEQFEPARTKSTVQPLSVAGEERTRAQPKPKSADGRIVVRIEIHE